MASLNKILILEKQLATESTEFTEEKLSATVNIALPYHVTRGKHETRIFSVFSVSSVACICGF